MTTRRRHGHIAVHSGTAGAGLVRGPEIDRPLRQHLRHPQQQQRQLQRHQAQ